MSKTEPTWKVASAASRLSRLPLLLARRQLSGRLLPVLDEVHVELRQQHTGKTARIVSVIWKL